MAKRFYQTLSTAVVALAITACSNGPGDDDGGIYQAYIASKEALTESMVKHSVGEVSDADDVYYYVRYERLENGNYPIVVSREKVARGESEVTSLHAGLSVSEISPSPEVVACDASPYGCLRVEVQNSASTPFSKVKVGYMLFERDSEGGRGLVSTSLKLSLPTLNPGEFTDVVVPISQPGEWVGNSDLTAVVLLDLERYHETTINTGSYRRAMKPYITTDKGVSSLFYVPAPELQVWETEQAAFKIFVGDIIDALRHVDSALSQASDAQRDVFYQWSERRHNEKDEEWFDDVNRFLYRLQEKPAAKMFPEVNQLQALQSFADR